MIFFPGLAFFTTSIGLAQRLMLDINTLENTLEGNLIDKISRSFSIELPVKDSMDDYLDFIIPLVRPWGEDLYEQEYYLNTRWLEISDEDAFHESILHIFQVEGSYLISIDGNISQRGWSILPKSNTLILQEADQSIQGELYDLAFMNADFFILRKHGNQKRKGNKKYFVMARESLVRGLEWRDVMELMFNRYRNNSQFIVIVAVIIFILAALVVLSFF
ncbi:MAG: hypothetical protein AAGG75_26445 [Bacteroidota bacterium]